MPEEKPKNKFAYMLTAGEFCEIYEEAIKLAQSRGKKEGDDFGQEMLEVAKKKGINIDFLGATNQDAGLMTGNLREKGFKILNLNEVERRKNMFLSFEEIKKNYDKIQYKADDGKWYYLKDKFPICMQVKDDKKLIYLDTGGEMKNCYFEIYQFTKDGLYLKERKVTDIKGL